MRILLWSSLVIAWSVAWPGPTLPAEKAPAKRSGRPAALAEARSRLLRGNYEEAREAFQAAATKDAQLAPAAAIGVAQSYALAGEYDQAAKVLDQAVKSIPDQPDVLAARAWLRYELGQWDDAEKDADAAMAKEEYQLLARYTKACVLRDRGKTTEADAIYRSVVRYYTKRSNDDDDITDAEELWAVAQCGAENARWHNLPKQFSFILNEVIADALKSEKNYWPAEVLAGDMLLEKYNRPDAVEAYDKALQVNPKAAAAYVGKGEAALMKFELRDAEGFADQALKHNPRFPPALRLKADILILAGDFAAAEKLLQAARAVNPRDSLTLGRIAALFVLTQRGPEFDALVKEVASFDAKPGLFYLELARVLEERKHLAPAEEYYKKAADLRPTLPGPRTGLALLQLRMGHEEEARKLLDAAFKLDPFNVKVANSRKVLDHLSKYETLQTTHYAIRFDPKSDKVLAEFLAEFLEETHEFLKQQFGGYEPPGRTLVEIFNSHEMFSGRTVGLPDLHTVGACTGKVVAMASPRAKGVAKPFSWGRVMRHELTHIFNLAQTNYLCPHWLTEGLAVRNENISRPPLWSQILRDRWNSNELLNLDTIMLAFVRPRSPEEWTLAYCQSQLYVDYLVKKYGEAAVGKILNSYKTGADTATVLKQTLGVDKAAFEAGYRKHLEQVVQGLQTHARSAEKSLSFDELVAAVEKAPEDTNLKARLAEACLRRNRAAEAKKLADEVLVKDPGQPLAAVVKAKLLQRAGDEDAARAVLKQSLKANPDDPRLLAQIGRLHLEAKEFAEAAAVLEKGRKVAPLEGDWLEPLARVYKVTQENDKLISVLREWLTQDADELEGRVQLARLYLEAGQVREAELSAREAIQIDVTHKGARDVLLDAVKAAKKDTEYQKLQKRFAE